MTRTSNYIALKTVIFLFVLAFAVVCGNVTGRAQSTDQKATTAQAPKKSSSAKPTDREVIDSLNESVLWYQSKLVSADSMYRAEQAVSTDLREQVIRLDDYRQKLEANLKSYKGENLHLNQSNRILIIFNAMVAVLLLITLVFFLRRLGRKSAPKVAKNNGSGTDNPGAEPAQFEDKIALLERLGKLREKGLLSEEEFLSEKHRLFGK